MGSIWAYGTLLVVTIAQSTLVHNLTVQGVKPDLVLLTLIYLAHKNGIMPGQTLGFLSGIVNDFLSIAPLGFNAFINTILGFLFGITAESFFIDSVFIPMTMAAVATLIKGLSIVLLQALFTLEALYFSPFTLPFAIEIAYNMVCAPFLFAGLRLVKGLSKRKQWEDV